MKTALCPNGRSLAACLVLVLSPWLGFAAGFEATVVQTNGLDRWITNVVEVRMPVNHFVNQYHTNHIEVVRTNVVAFYATNWVTRLHTNIVWLNVPRTNWVSTVRTNTVVLEAVKTNFVVAYQTNLKTLNLTNWKTVLILKTNWVIQPITNVAEIEMVKRELPPEAQGSKVAPGQRQAKTAGLAEPLPATLTEALALGARAAGRLSPSNQMEVRLTVHWTNSAAAPVRVQQWRVERDDGSILCFGQDVEFKRQLPVGRYTVEVKARREENGPLLAALGTLAVTPREVMLQQKRGANK